VAAVLGLLRLERAAGGGEQRERRAVIERVEPEQRAAQLGPGGRVRK
jgi:hypothetical protein